MCVLEGIRGLKMLFVYFPHYLGTSQRGDPGYQLDLIPVEQYEAMERAGYRVRRSNSGKLDLHVAHCIHAMHSLFDGTWLDEPAHKTIDAARKSGRRVTGCEPAVALGCCFKEENLAVEFRSYTGSVSRSISSP